MSESALFTEEHNLLAAIDPASYNSAQSTGWVDMADYNKAVAIILVGLIASTGTFNAKLEQAKTSGGGSAKDITGKAITQMDDTKDNKRLAIEVDATELDVSGGFRYIRLTLTPATAATIVGAALIGFRPRFPPPGTANWEQVVN